MPAYPIAGTPLFAASVTIASAGVLVEREGEANTLFCRESDAEAAFAEFFDTLTGGAGPVTLETLP